MKNEIIESGSLEPELKPTTQSSAVEAYFDRIRRWPVVRQERAWIRPPKFGRKYPRYMKRLPRQVFPSKLRASLKLMLSDALLKVKPES